MLIILGYGLQTRQVIWVDTKQTPSSHWMCHERQIPLLSLIWSFFTISMWRKCFHWGWTRIPLCMCKGVHQDLKRVLLELGVKVLMCQQALIELYDLSLGDLFFSSLRLLCFHRQLLEQVGQREVDRQGVTVPRAEAEHLHLLEGFAEVVAHAQRRFLTCLHFQNRSCLGSNRKPRWKRPWIVCKLKARRQLTSSDTTHRDRHSLCSHVARALLLPHPRHTHKIQHC